MVAALLTYKELSDRWKIPINTLRIWVMQGKLKPIKFSRLVRFSEAYISELETQGGIR